MGTHVSIRLIHCNYRIEKNLEIRTKFRFGMSRDCRCKMSTGRRSHDTDISRIQTSKDFENFAFYATYKKADSDKYMGRFRKEFDDTSQLRSKQAEKQANASGSEADLAKATTLRDKANSMKV